MVCAWFAFPGEAALTSRGCGDTAITELWTIAQSVHGDVSMNNIILPMAQVEIHKRMDALNAQKGIGGATDSGPAAGPSSSAIPVD